jgi:ELWxxDGT repeat protein
MRQFALTIGLMLALTSVMGCLEGDDTSALDDQITELENENSALKDNIAGVEDERDSLAAEKSQLEADVSDKNNELATAEAARSALQTSLDNITAERDTLQDALDAEEDESDNLTAQITQLDSEIVQLEAAIEQADSDIAALNTDIASLNADIAVLNADIAALNASLASLLTITHEPTLAQKGACPLGNPPIVSTTGYDDGSGSGTANDGILEDEEIVIAETGTQCLGSYGIVAHGLTTNSHLVEFNGSLVYYHGAIETLMMMDMLHVSTLKSTDSTVSGTIGLVDDYCIFYDSYDLEVCMSYNFDPTHVGNKLFVAMKGGNEVELFVTNETANSGISLGYFDGIGDMIAFGDKLLFQADDDDNGWELWLSDGTSDGTTLLKDINPGASDSLNVNNDIMYLHKNNVYFSARDGSSGYELWRTDGTDVGTLLVKDINPGSGASYPLYFTSVGDTLFFRAIDGSNGYELWTTDGSSTGTSMLKDIYAGSSSGNPNYLTPLGNTLYFSANDGTNYTELWKSDGTEEGTVMVKDINDGGYGSPYYFTPLGNILYFRASDGTHGSELWKSDGTDEGTVMVRDIWSGSSSSNPWLLVTYNGILYFRAYNDTYGYELWKSDGTEQGTQLALELTEGSASSNINDLIVIGNVLYLKMTPAGSYVDPLYSELWWVDLNQY